MILVPQIALREKEGSQEKKQREIEKGNPIDRELLPAWCLHCGRPQRMTRGKRRLYVPHGINGTGDDDGDEELKRALVVPSHVTQDHRVR